MMSDDGANPISFNKRNKDWTSRAVAIPHPLHPITILLCLTRSLSLKVKVKCVSPLTKEHKNIKSVKVFPGTQKCFYAVVMFERIISIIPMFSHIQKPVNWIALQVN